MNDQTQSRSLVEVGLLAIAQQQWEKLDQINMALYNLFPFRDQQDAVNRGFTGIVQ
jgi:hypothetical protein